MRQERTVQATIFEVFAGHEIGCELRKSVDRNDSSRSTYSSSELSYYYALLPKFTLCGRYFSSLLTGAPFLPRDGLPLSIVSKPCTDLAPTARLHRIAREMLQ